MPAPLKIESKLTGKKTSRLHNDKTKVYSTITFPNCHANFTDTIKLTFSSALDSNDTKKHLKYIISDYKKAYSAWKASGNGNDNKDESSQQVTYHYVINDSPYLDGNHHGDDQDNDLEIQHIDDDRSKFVHGNIAILYFWAVPE